MSADDVWELDSCVLVSKCGVGRGLNSAIEASLSSGNSCLGRVSLTRGVRRDGFRGLCSLMNAFRGLDRGSAGRVQYDGDSAPNERRDKIKFSRDSLIPPPRRQISEPEPLNFLGRTSPLNASLIAGGHSR